MSTEQEQIDYEEIYKKYPWILERNQDCILSPDSDGFLCGLLMSHVLGWKIRGFYDGKVLLVEKGINARECVFLDMEIFRKDVRSMGQHMVMFNKNDLPKNWENFENCISLNDIRNFDHQHNFQQKYPFGTVHALLAIIGKKYTVPQEFFAKIPLLYTDGTFKNLLNYPENCLSWLTFLGARDEQHPMKKIFFEDTWTLGALMEMLEGFFAEIKIIGGGVRGGDKLKISDGQGKPMNIDMKHEAIEILEQQKVKAFLRMLGEKTGWTFQEDAWSFGKYRIVQLKKGTIKPGKARYDALMQENPVSLAMTSSLSIEYTLDPEGIF